MPVSKVNTWSDLIRAASTMVQSTRLSPLPAEDVNSLIAIECSELSIQNTRTFDSITGKS